jgi:Na+/H+ antiporter NhaC
MSEQKKNGQEDLKEYAGGWMTERKGTDAPGFLKLAFPVIGLGCTAYLLLQMYGDVNHATRGPLVQQFNAVSKTSPVLSYTVALLALIYVIVTVVFAFRKPHED